MKRIVWLASYPKSGSTWFRAFLANYRRGGNAPAGINTLDPLMASERSLFNESLGLNSGELADDEIDRLRPDVYRQLATEASETVFVKVHDAYASLPGGQAMFPPDATAGVLYFVRNPLDVCVSFAHHGGHADHERTLRRMADAASVAAGGPAGQLRMRYSTWSAHVTGWVDAPGQRVHVVRFEDLKLRPETTFAAAARFAGLPEDPERLARAIAFSRFEELQKQEQASGFFEKPPGAPSFFRRGDVGSWREALTPEQAKRICAAHGETMRRFGYLDARGEPVF